MQCTVAILKWLFKNLDGETWAEMFGLRIAADGRHL
jgi:hypothetical protein